MNCAYRATAWALCAASWAALTACASSRPGGSTGASPRDPSSLCVPTASVIGSPQSAVPPPPALLGQLAQIARRFEPFGARPVGVLASGYITQGVNVSTAIDVPANTCLSIVAVASSGIADLDAHLFNPAGQLIVQDVGEDARPTVQLCATDARRVFHVIEAFQGQGAYAVATFAADRRGLEAIARMLRESGGAPGTALAGGAQTSDADGRLAGLRDGIARRSFTVEGDAQRAQFHSSGSIRLTQRVLAERCYTFAAFADQGQQNVDIVVRDTEGAEIARDVRSDRDAVVQVCPATTGPLTLEVVAAGAGDVLLQTFGADAASMAGANTLWLGERSAWTASATSVTDSVERVRQFLVAEGYAPVGSAVTSNWQPGESRVLRAMLEPARCHVLAAISGRGLGPLEIAVHDASGEFVARAHGRGPGAFAVACVAARDAATVHARALVGSGDAGTWWFTGAAMPSWGSGADRVAVDEALGAALGNAQDGWRNDAAPERIRLGAHARRSREFDVAPNTCVRWTLSAGHGLPTMSLRVFSDAGLLEGDASREGSTTVTRCGRAAQRMRLVSAADDDGPTEFDAFLWRSSRPESGAGIRR